MNSEPFSKLSYGLFAVSSLFREVKNGFIANTVFQVTSSPPQLGVSCSKNNYTTNLIASSGKFTVSVLHQQASPELIGTFGYQSGRDVFKFGNVRNSLSPSGIPVVIQDTVAWFECEVTATLDMGSHILFVGKVLHCELLDDKSIPLTYSWYREVKKGFSPKNAPTYIDPGKQVSAPEVTTSPLKRYQCLACNYIYDPVKGDPDSGILPGTAFEDIAEDWICPVCGATKEMFEEIQG